MPGIDRRLLVRWSMPVGLAAGLLAGAVAVAVIDHGVPVATSGPRVGEEGPWGRIERLDFTFEPDLPGVLAADCPKAPHPWTFPGTDAAGVRRLLRQAGLTGAQADALVAGATCDGSGCVVRPDAAQSGALSRRARAGLYPALAANGANPWMREMPIRTLAAFRGSLEASGLPAPVRRRIASMIFPWGQRHAFVDAAAACAGADDDVRRRVARFFAGTDTSLARLLVAPGADVERLAHYWAGARRSTGVPSLIASLTDPPCGGRLDVGHMLPLFVRERVNRLARADEIAADGLWLALHFSEDTRHPAWMDAGAAEDVLRADWRPVSGEGVALGDLVRFRAGPADIAAIHVADGMLITRWSRHRFSPWVLTDREAVVQALEPLGPVAIQAFRKRVR